MYTYQNLESSFIKVNRESMCQKRDTLQMWTEDQVIVPQIDPNIWAGKNHPGFFARSHHFSWTNVKEVIVSITNPHCNFVGWVSIFLKYFYFYLGDIRTWSSWTSIFRAENCQRISRWWVGSCAYGLENSRTHGEDDTVATLGHGEIE